MIVASAGIADSNGPFMPRQSTDVNFLPGSFGYYRAFLCSKPHPHTNVLGCSLDIIPNGGETEQTGRGRISGHRPSNTADIIHRLSGGCVSANQRTSQEQGPLPSRQGIGRQQQRQQRQRYQSRRRHSSRESKRNRRASRGKNGGSSSSYDDENSKAGRFRVGFEPIGAAMMQQETKEEEGHNVTNRGTISSNITTAIANQEEVGKVFNANRSNEVVKGGNDSSRTAAGSLHKTNTTTATDRSRIAKGFHYFRGQPSSNGTAVANSSVAVVSPPSLMPTQAPSRRRPRRRRWDGGQQLRPGPSIVTPEDSLHEFEISTMEAGPNSTGPGSIIKPMTARGIKRYFFNRVLEIGQGPQRVPGASVLQVFLNPMGRYAFIEFRTAEEAVQILNVGSLLYQGVQIHIGRPTGFDETKFQEAWGLRPQPQQLDLAPLGVKRRAVGPTVEEGPGKIYAAGFPLKMYPEQIQEIFEAFGPLKGLYLPRDPLTQKMKGWVFAQYQDPAVTDRAIRGLHGMRILNQNLQVRKALLTPGGDENPFLDPQKHFGNAPEMQPHLAAMCHLSLLQPGSVSKSPSRVVVILGCATNEQLKDDTEYLSIFNDIRQGVEQFGNISKLIIPRPGQGLAGVGRVYVKFVELKAAIECTKGMKDAMYGENYVKTVYWPEVMFLPTFPKSASF
eukprot:jgi/Bigna1/128629/aug1.7_g3337